jgi:hypothetical protein
MSLNDTWFGNTRTRPYSASNRQQVRMETVQPLRVSVELLANLIYLAGRNETHSAQQRRYLDWAATVIEELQHHPKLRE